MIEHPESDLITRLRRATLSESGQLGARLQSLWSGYGAIYRFHPGEGKLPLIVKFVSPPNIHTHPRGWAGEKSHERKLRSYDVELHFYQSAGGRCDDRCRIASATHLSKTDDSWLFVLEDLDHAGFSGRRTALSGAEMRACLRWLAEFHARHLGIAPQGLWAQGTYWHLATRPDELSVMKHERLKNAASAIDEALSGCCFQTWVHGDAKVENFCFSPEMGVAVVDFQYVGAGVGVKDVAYFLSSCLDEQQCLKDAEKWVDEYFHFLDQAIRAQRHDVDPAEVIREWRRVYPYAWADFVRFLVGWAPGHFKLHGYSKKLTEEVLARLGR